MLLGILVENGIQSRTKGTNPRSHFLLKIEQISTSSLRLQYFQCYFARISNAHEHHTRN